MTAGKPYVRREQVGMQEGRRGLDPPPPFFPSYNYSETFFENAQLDPTQEYCTVTVFLPKATAFGLNRELRRLLCNGRVSRSWPSL